MAHLFEDVLDNIIYNTNVINHIQCIMIMWYDFMSVSVGM